MHENVGGSQEAETFRSGCRVNCGVATKMVQDKEVYLFPLLRSTIRIFERDRLARSIRRRNVDHGPANRRVGGRTRLTY